MRKEELNKIKLIKINNNMIIKFMKKLFLNNYYNK